MTPPRTSLGPLWDALYAAAYVQLLERRAGSSNPEMFSPATMAGYCADVADCGVQALEQFEARYDGERPTYNHTRGDGLAAPCPRCRASTGM